MTQSAVIKLLSEYECDLVRETSLDDGIVMMISLHGNVLFHRVSINRHNMVLHSKCRSILTSGITQYDPPYTNYSDILKVWKVVDDGGFNTGEAIIYDCLGKKIVKDMIADEEVTYSRFKRDYAVKYKLTFDGRRITMETPIEAFGFIRKPELYVYDETYKPFRYEDDEDDEYN